MKRIGTWIALAAILVIAGVAIWWLTASAPSKQPQVAAPQAIPVEVATVSRADVPIYLTGLGTVQAFNTVTVTARVDGQLEKVAFVEGQEVKKGDLLAQIDARPYKAAFDIAVAKKAQDEAQLANSEHDLDRYVTLSAQNYTSKQTLDTTRALVAQLTAQIKGDQAAIDSAKTQLDYTAIVSPIDGRTGIRQIDEGNIVRAANNNGIVVITQLHPISVIFTLPEDELSSVSRAMGVGPVEVDALTRDGRSMLDQGTIALIDNQIDQATGTIRLRANFTNPNDTMWPGEFVNARVLMRIDKSVLTVPSAAVQRGANGFYTWVVKPDATVESRPITVDEDNGTIAVIAAGISDGEQVVTVGQYRLQAKSHVQIGNQAAGATAVNAEAEKKSP
jgi:multidrug efflux system membrane fusion protein